MRKVYPSIAIFFAMVLIITACTAGNDGKLISPTPTALSTIGPRSTATLYLVIGDGGLLSDEPCGPPCFWGIEPGKTTQAEVLDILTSKGVINVCNPIDNYQFAIEEDIGGWTCQSILDIEFRKQTGFVSRIRFAPTQPIELQDLIAKRGFPDGVVILSTGIPEAPTFQASIYYSSLGIVLPLLVEQANDGTGYKISPTTPIDVVGYMDGDSLEHDLEVFKGNIFPWKGYGGYISSSP